MKNFYSNGKLLITNEYLVLDGAISLALPTKFGQNLKVTETTTKTIVWRSYNVANECWFTASFGLDDFEILTKESKVIDAIKIATTLQEILKSARQLNKQFLQEKEGVEVVTTLTFPNEWGLGTSSTLINSVASWANVNAFELLEKSFGGSGYDIACAQCNFPITYQRNGIAPYVKKITFDPSFKEQLFFVYSNQKQDSKEGIKMFKELTIDKKILIAEMNELSINIIEAKSLTIFEKLITEHELKLASVLGLQPVKEKLFPDFTGAIKSLGAWGGDFVLVTGASAYVKQYFTEKGYTTILSYEQMILQS